MFDSTFYELGKPKCIPFESVATNVWTPILAGIALLFGIGNAFDSIASLVAYAFMLKKQK